MKTETEIKKELRHLRKMLKEYEATLSRTGLKPRMVKAIRDCSMSLQAQINILKWVLRPPTTEELQQRFKRARAKLIS